MVGVKLNSARVIANTLTKISTAAEAVRLIEKMGLRKAGDNGRAQRARQERHQEILPRSSECAIAEQFIPARGHVGNVKILLLVSQCAPSPPVLLTLTPAFTCAVDCSVTSTNRSRTCESSPIGVTSTFEKYPSPFRRSVASSTSDESYCCPGCIRISRKITLSLVLSLPLIRIRPSAIYRFPSLIS